MFIVMNKSVEQELNSADRNNKVTLPLTILRSIQVVCKGFILSNISNCDSVAPGRCFRHLGTHPVMTLMRKNRIYL